METTFALEDRVLMDFRITGKLAWIAAADAHPDAQQGWHAFQVMTAETWFVYSLTLMTNMFVRRFLNLWQTKWAAGTCNTPKMISVLRLSRVQKEDVVLITHVMMELQMDQKNQTWIAELTPAAAHMQ